MLTTTLYKYLSAIEKTSRLATSRLAQTQRLLTGLHRVLRGLTAFVATLVVFSFVALSVALSGPQYATTNTDRAAAPPSPANIAPRSPANVAPASTGNVLPLDIGSAGHRTGLSQKQREYAAAIIAKGEKMGIPRRGLVIAVATAMQESKLLMYANSSVPASLKLPHDAVGSDHDSVGLFQQRPSWGTMAERMDATTSAHRFYHALEEVPGWQHLPLTVAAQTVQRSAFPRAYAKWEPLAKGLVAALAPLVGPPADKPEPPPQPEEVEVATTEPEPPPAPEQDEQDEVIRPDGDASLVERIVVLREAVEEELSSLLD